MRLLFVVLMGCSTGTLTDTESTAELPTASVCEDASCVRAGDHSFLVDGAERRLVSAFPEQTAGAPVLVVFHHLNGSPEELLQWWQLDRAVEDGFVVVVPASRGLPGSEWAVTGSPGGNEDVALFDAIVDTLVDVQAVDAERVYATGFSAGGLMTSYLTLHRADALAATAPFSGGAPITNYVTPTADIPVMVSWGGPSDTYGGFDFDGASRNLVDSLVDDGHLVQSCEHVFGHWLPLDATDRTLSFFREHAATGTVLDFEGCDRMAP